MNSPTQWIAGLRERFLANASAGNAARMKAYLRGQFDFIGIKTPERRALVRAYLREQELPPVSELEAVVREMWRRPEREMQLTAMELLERRVEELEPKHLPLLEEMVTHKSWWDTVDFISYKLAGELLARHRGKRRPVARRWSKHENLWLNRVSILCQLLRKNDTDAELLEEMIRRHAEHQDFFIRKAIGWALRDHAYTDPNWVKRLVAEAPLSKLSRREALKNL